MQIYLMSAYFVEFNFDWHLLRDSSPIPKQLRNIKHIRIGLYYDFPGGASGKEPTSQSRRCARHRFDAWVRKTPWRRIWQPAPVFLPGESHGHRSLGGYSPRGRKESDTTGVTAHRHQFSSIQSLSRSLSHSITSDEVTDISPSNLDSSLCFIQPSILHNVLCI